MRNGLFRFGVLIPIAIGSLNAATVSLGMKSGFNAQNCNSVNIEDRPKWRLGVQGGVDFELYFSRGCQPIQFGLETGLLFQNVRYFSVIPAMPAGDLEFNDLTIPLWVKLKEKLSPETDLKVGAGWVIKKHLNAYYGSRKLLGENFSIGHAFQCKAEVSIKINPKLCFTPSLCYQIHLIEDYPTLLIKIENARSFILDLGVSFKL